MSFIDKLIIPEDGEVVPLQLVFVEISKNLSLVFLYNRLTFQNKKLWKEQLKDPIFQKS